MSLPRGRVTADAGLLAAWKGTEEYDAFVRYLEMVAQGWETRILNGTTESLDTIRYAQGVLAGLRLALDAPTRVAILAKG